MILVFFFHRLLLDPCQLHLVGHGDTFCSNQSEEKNNTLSKNKTSKRPKKWNKMISLRKGTPISAIPQLTQKSKFSLCIFFLWSIGDPKIFYGTIWMESVVKVYGRDHLLSMLIGQNCPHYHVHQVISTILPTGNPTQNWNSGLDRISAHPLLFNTRKGRALYCHISRWDF